ncbi:MAG: TrbI F-type domain-containing protein [Gammaproteobacteria bacterium]
MKINSPFFTNHIYSILFGMLGSMIILTVFVCVSPKPQKIGIVNITSIVNEFVRKESKEDKPQNVLTKEVKNFGIDLEKTLTKLSIEDHILLMPSEAVISGSQNYTDLVKNKMNEKYNQ